MTQEEYQEWFRSELISQLADSERFRQFVAFNYDIHQVVDKDTKNVRLQVIEVPHTIAQERIKEAATERMADLESKISVVPAGALDKLNKA